jgi:hypothetical protein
MSGNYVGGLRASPPVLGPATPGKPTFVLEARAEGLDVLAVASNVSVEWAPSDPSMVTVSPGGSHQVTITVNGAGRSTIRVASPDVVETLSVNATPYLGDPILVAVSR